MATDTPRGEVTLWEDFVKDNSDLNETNVDGATQDITTRHGGWWRQVMAGDDADAALLANELVFEADEGFQMIYEWRGFFTTANVAAAFLGFSDDPVETNAIPTEDENGAQNVANATDCVGFLIEGETDLTWLAGGVQNTVGNDTAQPIALTAGPDAANSVAQTLRLELNPNDSGTVLYFINGDLVSTQTAYFRSQIVYCACVASDDRNGAFNLDTDYIYAMAPRS